MGTDAETMTDFSMSSLLLSNAATHEKSLDPTRISIVLIYDNDANLC